MAHPADLIAPMREELSRMGIIEARTPEQVDELLSPESGTVLVVVNSVCACAAWSARPGVVRSLRCDIRPDKVATVFAGGDLQALARLRQILAGHPPSSPSVALFRDGEPVFMLHRREIEERDPSEVAAMLQRAYQRHCVAS